METSTSPASAVFAANILPVARRYIGRPAGRSQEIMHRKRYDDFRTEADNRRVTAVPNEIIEWHYHAYSSSAKWRPRAHGGVSIVYMKAS